MKNESGIDRIIRAILAIILLILGKFVFTGILSLAAYVIGIILLVTAVTGFCALYKLFGIDTANKNK